MESLVQVFKLEMLSFTEMCCNLKSIIGAGELGCSNMWFHSCACCYIFHSFVKFFVCLHATGKLISQKNELRRFWRQVLMWFSELRTFMIWHLKSEVQHLLWWVFYRWILRWDSLRLNSGLNVGCSILWRPMPLLWGVWVRRIWGTLPRQLVQLKSEDQRPSIHWV